MNIVLNPELEEIKFAITQDMVPRIVENYVRFQEGLSRQMPKLEATKEYKLLTYMEDYHASPYAEGFSGYQKSMAGFVAAAYDRHLKIEIAPHDVWFVLLTEMARIIKDNADELREHFTDSAEQKQIMVYSDDPTKIDIAELTAALRKLVPIDIGIFLPKISTHTAESEIACLAAFCDGMQVYYEYATFCCGIPEIRVIGSDKDWSTLIMQLNVIDTYLGRIKGFADWSAEVRGILIRIRQVIDGDVDLSFWSGIFTSRNVGSGGQLEVSGWITKLFFGMRSAPMLDDLPNALAIVPYTSLETNRRFSVVHGALKRIRMADGFHKLGYGSLVFEHVDKQDLPGGAAVTGSKRGEMSVVMTGGLGKSALVWPAIKWQGEEVSPELATIVENEMIKEQKDKE